MIKKNPYYRVTVYHYDTNGEPLQTIIEYPITCKFNSQRSAFSSSNKCTIDLYNLSNTTRDVIFKDALTIYEKQWKYIKLEAGWNGVLAQIFNGKILQAYSSKEGGQVDIVTHIECQPFDIFTAQSAYTFSAGTSYKDAYKTLAADLKDCNIGNIGTLEGTFKTQTTFEGSTLECLNTLTGGNTFVDNGTINTIMSNEVIDVPVPVMTDENGLLGAPIRREASLTIKTLFEPTLIIGQLVEIKSKIQPIYNGQYKVIGFTHDCLISPTQAGQRVTTIDLWIAPLLTASDVNLTGEALTGGASEISSFNKVKGEQVTVAAQKEPTSVREVYLYLQRNNGQIPNTKITKNISWKEVLGNDNTPQERKQECTISVLSKVYSTAQYFQSIIDKYFQGATVIINSGWRSERNNRQCRGNPNSKHKEGLAIDFTLSGKDQYAVYQIFKKVWRGYVEYYKKENFIHVQIDRLQGLANDR